MSEIKYSPGPWSIAKQPYNLVVLDNAGHLVATAYGWNEHGHMEQPPEGQANAHLIAAAPELYEALNEVSYHLENNLPIWYTQGMHKRMKAALEKAEGKK